jgi:hypothetical protein
MHERGLADDKLIEDHERDRFDGIAGTGRRDDTRVDDADGRSGEGERPAARQVDDGRDADRTDYEQGRVDERESERR